MTAKTKNRVQPAAAGRLNSRAELEKPSEFPLLKHNFKLMAIAALVIVVGFLLILGPGSSEEAFNPDIFSTRRIVVGPTVAFLGFLFMGFAIIYRQKPKKQENKGNAAIDGVDHGCN